MHAMQRKRCHFKDGFFFSPLIEIEMFYCKDAIPG